MFDDSSPHRQQEIDVLIRRSDELIHRTKELTSHTLNERRLAELRQLSTRLLANCDKLIGALKHHN